MLEKIKKIKKETTQKMIFCGLVMLMFGLPIPQCLMPDAEKAIMMQGTVLMGVLFYFASILLIEILNRRLNLKKAGIAFLTIVGLIVIGLVSVILSHNKELALYGSYNRAEGFFSLASYYAIFLTTALLVKKEFRRWVVYMFLLLGSIVAILGIIQFSVPWQWGERFYGMAYVPMRNPNFYGAFSVLYTGVSIGGFLIYKVDSVVTHPFRWWTRPFWFLLVLLGYAACVSADSSVVYVGLIMIFLIELFLEIVTKQRKFVPLALLIIGLIVIMYILDLIRGGSVMEEFTSVGKQIYQSGSMFADSVGTKRMGVWKRIIALLPECWLFGYGIENLGTIYLERYGIINGIYYDKAHNEYLNLWITEGIFALIFYLVFLFALFLPGVMQFIKKAKQRVETIKEDYVFDEITAIVFFAFFGYIAQAFFNISVVQVAPYFWIICGLLYSRKREKNE